MENAVAVANYSLFTKDGRETMLGLASNFAGSDIIPATFQKKPANVLVALDMAARMDMPPLMVMQNLYVVHGNPAWSSKFLIGLFNQCGRFSPIRYEFFGKPGTDEYGCRAYATELATGEKLVGPDVTIDIAKKEGWYGKTGSKWQTMPQLMLTYRAAAFFIRTCAPEISMGLTTTEELVDAGPVNVTNTGTVQDVVDKVEAETQAALETAKEEPAVEAFAEPVAAEAPAPEPVKARPF